MNLSEEILRRQDLIKGYFKQFNLDNLIVFNEDNESFTYGRKRSMRESDLEELNKLLKVVELDHSDDEYDNVKYIYANFIK